MRFAILVFVSVFLGVTFSDAFAQNFRNRQSASCDVEFADVLEARATLEAMRELEIAQTLILKPDSVLEYSCFHERNNDLDAVANIMFSDNVASTDLFNNPVLEFNPSGPWAAFLPTINTTTVTAPNNTGNAGLIVGPHPPPFPIGALHISRLGNLIGLVVSASLFEFVYANFGHEYAGGTYVGPVSTVCNPMNFVWEFVKCTNFNRDLFLTFAQLEAFDPRVSPLPCNDSARQARWTNALTEAYPAPGAAGGVAIAALGIAGAANNVYQHTNGIFNVNCSGIRPIATGVRVYTGSPRADAHTDRVCPAPGCYYAAPAPGAPLSAAGSCRATP